MIFLCCSKEGKKRTEDLSSISKTELKQSLTGSELLSGQDLLCAATFCGRNSSYSFFFPFACHLHLRKYFQHFLSTSISHFTGFCRTVFFYNCDLICHRPFFSPSHFFFFDATNYSLTRKMWEQYMSIACQKKEKEINAAQLIRKNMQKLFPG